MILIALTVVTGATLFFLDLSLDNGLKGLANGGDDTNGLYCETTYVDGELYERTCRKYDNALQLGYDEKRFAKGNSMSPAWDDGDVLFSRYLNDDEMLWVGNSYAFRYKNVTVAHRLVAFTEDGALVFKGDNNVGVEIVKREDVERLVVGVTYE